jgi:hypothetical protein
MQERQIGATRERERIARPRQERTSETADNPPFSLYEVRTLNTSRICHSSCPRSLRQTRIIWSIASSRLSSFAFSLSSFRVWRGNDPASLDTTGRKLADPGCLYDEHSTEAYHAAQAHSEPQDTTIPSPLLAIVLVDFISSHHSLLAFDCSLGTVNNKPRSIPPSPHCTTASSPNRPRTHRSLCTAIV